MSKVQIVYKSGVTVNVDVEEFTVNKNHAGAVISLKWTNGKDRVAYLAIDDLAAVIYK